MKRPESEAASQPRWRREPTPEEMEKIDRLVESGRMSHYTARCSVQGLPDITASKEPVRKGPNRRHARVFEGRADQFRGGPAPAAPGHEQEYEKGIKGTLEALAKARLSHPSEIKTESVLAALLKN